MSGGETSEAGERVLELSVPDLAEAFGSGCCAMTGDCAARQELESWPDVIDVEVDIPARRVTVRIDGPVPTRDDVLDSLACLGLPASIVEADPMTARCVR